MTIQAEIHNLRDRKAACDRDPAFEALVKNRRIAVVGPARTLLGAGLGPLIDSYDVVVRFNDAFQQLPISPELAVDLGTKADILYCNQVILRKDIVQQNSIPHARLATVCKEANIGFFVCTNNALDFEADGAPRRKCAKADRHLSSEFAAMCRQFRIDAHYRTVYSASETIMRWMNGQCGRTGFVGIVDLLHYDIDHLFIAGMTFYHGGGHLLAPATAELHPLKNRDGSWARDHTGLGHDSFVELELMKLLYQSFGERITVDATLAALIQTE